MDALRQELEARATREGFSGLRITRLAADPQQAARLHQFIAEGRHGSMDWLAETEARRASPLALWALPVIFLAGLCFAALGLIVTTLALEGVAPESIDDDASLFGEGLGLDSIDAIELGVAIRKRYGISLDAESDDPRRHFASVTTLAAFVAANRTL